MTDESRRVYSTDGRQIRTVSWKCRRCDRVTTWEQPTSLRAYKYGICAPCAAAEWGRLIGVRVAEDPHGTLKG